MQLQIEYFEKCYSLKISEQQNSLRQINSLELARQSPKKSGINAYYVKKND